MLINSGNILYNYMKKTCNSDLFIGNITFTGMRDFIHYGFPLTLL